MTTTPRRPSVAAELRFAVVLATVCLFLPWAMPAKAGEVGALTPIDTSSPRDTLQGFLEFMNQGYGTGVGLVQSYLASPQLYIAPEDTANIRRAFRYQEAAHRALDLSELPPATVHESARRLAIQLKEVLDRIDLSLIESIPDA